jgi:hypothetical protein
MTRASAKARFFDNKVVVKTSYDPALRTTNFTIDLGTKTWTPKIQAEVECALNYILDHTRHCRQSLDHPFVINIDTTSST